MGLPADDEDRWRARPLVAGVIGAAVFAIPIAASIAVAAVLGHVLARPTSDSGLAAWWR